ncbi:MAG: element excision factor XisH family protein [Nostoc sp. S4]|nr:element excision factor XisH family protein [Nostoc sp. S4]
MKDGWTITDDPFHLKWGKKDLYVDLGAEKLLIAEKGTQKIAVEIKTFSGDSEVADLKQAIGQYFTYLAVMTRNHADRVLYIAVHEDIFTDIFEKEPLGKLILEDYKIPLIVFNPKREVIVRWIL